MTTSSALLSTHCRQAQSTLVANVEQTEQIDSFIDENSLCTQILRPKIDFSIIFDSKNYFLDLKIKKYRIQHKHNRSRFIPKTMKNSITDCNWNEPMTLKQHSDEILHRPWLRKCYKNINESKNLSKIFFSLKLIQKSTLGPKISTTWL